LHPNRGTSGYLGEGRMLTRGKIIHRTKTINPQRVTNLLPRSNQLSSQTLASAVIQRNGVIAVIFRQIIDLHRPSSPGHSQQIIVCIQFIINRLLRHL
jgi:hypothetical protein